MPKIIQVRCTVCHQLTEINTNNEKLYQSDIVKENFVCPGCMASTSRIKIALTCSKCKQQFVTRIFAQHKDKYNGNWVCPMCADDSGQITGNVKTAGVPLDCTWCQHKHGVCPHPEVKCSLTNKFVSFNSCELYSIKKVCTIMSISKIDKTRDDIHSFGYSLLYKSKYLVSPSNLILIKYRLGSKKNFTTNVIVYKFKKAIEKFETIFNEKYDRGVDWIKPVKKFMMIEQPNLVV